MMEKIKKRLGEILMEDGILSREDLQKALEHQKKEGGMIGQVLVRLGLLTEASLIAALGKQLGIPYLPLMNYSMNMDALKILDVSFCREHLIIPFDQDDRHVFAAVGDPLDTGAVEELEKKSGLRPQVFLATPTEVIHILDMAANASHKKEIRKAG